MHLNIDLVENLTVITNRHLIRHCPCYIVVIIEEI